MTVDRPARLGLRFVALLYLAALLLIPVGVVFYRTFEHGVAAFWESITTPAAIHALFLTLEVAAITVPLNAAFGVIAAIALVRGRAPGKRLLDALIDLPFAISPIVVGLSLLLVFGRTGWFGPWLTDHGIQIIFSLPGIVIATLFVTLPFVVREVAPVLQEIGNEQEQAAATLGASGWQTFRRVTLPAIRWAIAYGVVLTTARALGEFGAVSVISGHIVGKTETMTLHVEAQYQQFDYVGAYAASVVLAMIAIATLVAMTLFKPKEEAR